MYLNATGYYIPEKRIPNEYFTEINGLTSDWIYQRTGIQTRSKATDEETIDYMSIEAVKAALPKLPYNIEEVDLIIFASYTPSDSVRTTAHVIQDEFNICKAKALYISAACSSGINAIETVDAFFKSGKASKALLVCSDRNSSYSHDNDPQAGHLWGDAATAYFFSKEKMDNKEARLVDVLSLGLGHIGKSDKSVYLDLEGDGIRMPHGKDVFINACTYIADTTSTIMRNNGYELSDLTYFVGHQANQRILKHVVKHLGLPQEISLSNIEELGNTGSASSLLVFSQNYDSFKSGDLICISVFGGGYSAGACLFCME
ncbi:3-oxoacyl-[acyl-carrier-protein] synthase-3 [Dysgonomonas sp. PH5-45]|uniref:3-oxoacyl-ACP synthase III family protein n=1 Tax=unclassified Dysgonomonas TaxID=2630389 RepID=UPI0024768CC0|nr:MULTISPECIES: ketoacyl-ACP synthase III [unclassified Dysgonomonas]MDH6354757.1 3-oxoacyl-[acyl-carrier-protein] synthase-3 [Dysgonomonas sp. PH5-45]MDH6387656.1 3-oxoacyl-[acyl-carrier-protein] synthase-3 [Dysgonomonas sp. PH5-37]